MMQKNTVWRKGFAFILSVLVVVIFIPSLFSIPLEFVIMNSETYAAIYEEETLVETGQEAFTSFIASTLTNPGENEIVPPIFDDTEKIGNVLQPYVTGEWVKEQLMSVTQQLLQFLNFQTPFGIVDVNLSALQESIATDQEKIVEDLYASYPACDEKDLQSLSSDAVNIIALPACDPPTEIKDDVTKIVSTYIEKYLFAIPQTYKINIEDSLRGNAQDTLLSYSIFRWTLRLLPIALILLLIGIALLLHKNVKEMRTWMGKLLLTVSIISILAVLVLLIGSEQFTAVFINRVMTADAGAFGALLLRVLQSVTYRTLLWMGIISIGFLCAGLLILFLNRGKKERMPETDLEEEFVEPPEEIMQEKKELIEETFDETEEEE